MITKNLRALLAAFTSDSNRSKSVKLKSEDGTVCLGGAYPSNTTNLGAAWTRTETSGSYAYNDYAYNDLRVGTGTTEPTADDYCLESETSALTLVSASTTGSYTNDNLSEGNSAKTIVTTYINSTTEAVTISEVGYFIEHANSYDLDGTNTTVRNFLMAREVIDPVEIGVGETYTFTFVIE